MLQKDPRPGFIMPLRDKPPLWKRWRLWAVVAAVLAIGGVAAAVYWLVLGQGFSGRSNMVRIITPANEYYIDAYEFPNRRGEIPKHKVSFVQARKACESVGKRLCTDWEWRRACLGVRGQNTFAYGSRFNRDRCHSGNILLSGHSGMVDTKKGILPSGKKHDCITPEGVYDMLGNLEEWVLTSWNGAPGILEGGAWFTVYRYADCTGRYSRQPNYRVSLEVPIFSAGFRCCWSANAPTEARLNKEDLARDSKQRLYDAQAWGSNKPYNSKDEVEVLPGLLVDRYEYPNHKGEYPLTSIPWARAKALCEKAGKRLCDVLEWEAACGGPKRQRFPYGEIPQVSHCGVELQKPMKTGLRPKCVSHGGVMDMSGGVWEWTASRFRAPTKVYGKDVVLRHVRGGSWFVDRLDSACRPLVGYPTSPQDATYVDVGFRCCRGKYVDPEPFAVLGTLGCPKGMVPIKDFCIQAHEYPNIAGHPPMHSLDFVEAKSACANAGLHVCSAKEWSAACNGPAKRHWPYGNRYDPERCHHGNLPSKNAMPLVSGQKSGCQTPEGIYDLCGNLWEWTTEQGGRAALRGGGTNFSAGYGRCDAKANSAHTFKSYETGVRCCANAKEANALLSGRFVPSKEPLDPVKLANVKPCSLQEPACPAGLFCNFARGLCMLLPRACVKDEGCGKDRRCYLPHNRCYEACKKKKQCVKPYICDAEATLCRPPAPTCATDEDCINGGTCNPKLYYCEGGKLPPDAGPPDLPGQPDLPRPPDLAPAVDYKAQGEPPREGGPPQEGGTQRPARKPKPIEEEACSLEKPRCPEGKYCNFVRGLCMLPPLDCQRDTDCHGRDRCYKPHGRCYSPCDAHGQCERPYSCDTSMTICRPKQPECTSDEDCKGGQTCHLLRYFCK